MKVKDVMTHHTRTCGTSADLEQVSLSMWDGDVGIMPVVDGDHRVIGVITDRDIAMASALQHRAEGQIKVGEVLGSQQVSVCSPDDSIEKVLEMMELKKIRRTPVVDNDGHIAGMVSLADIAAYTGVGKAACCTPERLVSAFKSIATPHVEQEKSVSQG